MKEAEEQGIVPPPDLFSEASSSEDSDSESEPEEPEVSSEDELSGSDDEWDPDTWREECEARNFVDVGEEDPVHSFTQAQLRLLGDKTTRESLEMLAKHPDKLD